MSLGDQNYNNNKGESEYIPVVYSSYSLKNPEGIDPSAVSFQYYRRMLRIAIAPMREMTDKDEYPTYDRDNEVKIFLTPAKAMIFLDEIDEFMKNPDSFKNAGVPSGTSGTASLISISNGRELETDKAQLIIRRIDENGNVVASAAYQFNEPDYYNSLRNFDQESKNFSYYPHNNIEIEILRKHLIEFINASTYATAYSFIEADKRNSERVYQIADSMGLTKSGKGKGGKGTSFFNKGNNSISNSAPAQRNQSSLEDIAGELES